MKIYLFYIKDNTWMSSSDDKYLLVHADSAQEAESKVKMMIRARRSNNDTDNWSITNCTIE